MAINFGRDSIDWAGHAGDSSILQKSNSRR